MAKLIFRYGAMGSSKTANVRDGKYVNKYKVVIVDEYQDRARQKVILVTLKDYKSDFANELISRYAAEMKQEAFICPQCGGRLRKRNGKFGEFYGCENYSISGCRYTRNIRSYKSPRSTDSLMPQ